MLIDEVMSHPSHIFSESIYSLLPLWHWIGREFQDIFTRWMEISDCTIHGISFVSKLIYWAQFYWLVTETRSHIEMIPH